MLVIGEKINASIKSVGEAIKAKDEDFFKQLAKDQAAAGADFIDVNSGTGLGSEQDQMATMTWLVDLVQSATEKPLCIDSDSPAVIKAALNKYRGDKLIINSVTAEPDRLENIGPLVANRGASVVALAMGLDIVPDNVAQRLEACETIMNYLTGLGIQPEQIMFDPLVLPISVDQNQGLVTLKTIEQIKSHYPEAKTVMGLSNISYGLPRRKVINRSFLLMSAYAGLDAVIVDPLDAKAMSLVKVADMLTGKDPSCRKYLRAHRKGAILD